MKKFLFAPLALIAALALASPATAGPVNLFVDSAPNAYGSPAYPGWWANAKAAAVAGTFVNMANSVNPGNAGTTNAELEDLVVYSFGDLGKRLHFVYWVPGETIASLTTKNFQIAMNYEWDGVTYDFYDEYYGSTWLTPGSWTEYSGGVIGTAGFAWWGAYNTNTQAELDADLAAWRPSQGDVTFRVRMDGEADSSLTAHVPDGGATATLMASALLGLGMLRRRFRP